MHKYLLFLEQYHQHLKDCKMSHYCEHILQEIAIYNAKNDEGMRPCTLLAAHHLGSPATIHKNYYKLVAKGYLKLRLNAQDKRIKYIELTPKANIYFNEINDLLKNCKNI